MTGVGDLQAFFARAAASGIIDAGQAERLAEFYAADARVPEPAAPPARFDVVHALWYLGALIAMTAMGLFTTEAFVLMGPAALLMTGVGYAILFALVGNALWRREMKTPGGLMIAAAVAMVPLAVFGLQAWLGWFGPDGAPGNYHDFYEWVKGGWVFMEIATIVAAAVAIRAFPFAFIAAIAAVALWFLSMDATSWVYRVEHFDWEQRAHVSIAFGLAVIVAAWATDLMQKRADYAFWLHLAGVAAFWGGLTSLHSDSELGKFVYALINLALIGLAVYLGRRVYAVFGALGIVAYLGDLSWGLFRDSLLFPFALSAVGLAVVGLGVVAFRKGPAIEAALEANLPVELKRLRPRRG